MLMNPHLQRNLAQVLYALQQGVENIKTSVYSIFSTLNGCDDFYRPLALPAIPLIPSVPRLYWTCRKLDGTEVPITFLSVFHGSQNKPIFNAKLDGAYDVIGKMTDCAYGAAVHEFLAEQGFAPKLLGTCTLDDRPTIYVMERLDNSWITLETWEQYSAAWQRLTVRPQVENGVKHIVGLLEGKGYVHGDLRTTNIMIKRVSHELKVIDFDWAGEAEHSHYPIDRNDDIEDWPKGSKQGGVISMGHDRTLVNNWLTGFLA